MNIPKAMSEDFYTKWMHVNQRAQHTLTKEHGGKEGKGGA